jgi:hypothetical protein
MPQMNTPQPAVAQDLERRPYTPPRLTVHGDVRQVTAERDPATGSISGGSAFDL